MPLGVWLPNFAGPFPHSEESGKTIDMPKKVLLLPAQKLLTSQLMEPFSAKRRGRDFRILVG